MRRRRFEKNKRMKKKRRLRRAELALRFIAVAALCSFAVIAVYNTGISLLGEDGSRSIFHGKGGSASQEKTLTEILTLDKDPQIEVLLAGMTPEEKVGQMFMGCFYSGTPSAKTVEKYHLGGVLLFGSSFKETPKKTLTARVSAIRENSGIAPLVAVDEEGGDVVRVSAYKEYRVKPFSSPRKLFDKGGMEAIIANAHEKNTMLRSLGINMNLAPVCDISQDPDDFMYSRSLGQDAQTTSLYATDMVMACNEDGVACSLKHFPGYGNSADTHKGLSVDGRPLEELQQRDLIPFQAGINAGAPSVMVSHNIVSALDDDLPASLSPSVHLLLRRDMGFDGVIITDDLSMGAITKFMPKEESAVYAVLAGNDLLCTGDYAKQHTAVLEALHDGVITEERVDGSVRRILKMKKDMGLL